MRTKNIIYALCGLVATTLAGGCSSNSFDEPAEPAPEVYSYTLNLDLDFKGTPDESDALSRAAMESIPDGAQIFLSLHLGEQADAESFTSHEPALAKYNAEKNEWTLYSKTELQANTFGCATAYYFGSDVFVEGTTFEEISIPATAPVFSAVSQYTMLGPNSVNMQATLKPEGVRVRFKYSSALSNPTNLSGLICPAEWNASSDDNIRYQYFPAITQSQWTANEGAYYTPYYTIYLYGESNESFFRLYCPSLPTYSRVRLFTVSDEVYIGETYTIDISESAARLGTYSTWTASDINASYIAQSSPGTFASYTPFTVAKTTSTGLRVKADFKVNGYAPEGEGYSNKFGLKFGSSYAQNFNTASFDTFTFTTQFEAGYEGSIDFSYLNPELLSSQSNYYNVYFVTDGVNVTFSNIQVSTF
ncbi:MAG: hypothetical protein K2L28_09900 [Muribaculaceae bacterium]|nr:hypothetical protein [Muribaculaceae bacterium]